jgi:hypothetical protein
MLSIAECRKFIGEAAENLSDEQIKLICDEFYSLADILVSKYLSNRGKPGELHDCRENGNGESGYDQTN